MAFAVRNVVVDARWNMLHPRDSKGRFTRSFTRVLKPQDNRLARKIIAAFTPKAVAKGAGRSTFFAAFGDGDSGANQQTRQAFQSGQLKAAHRAVRTEKAAVDSPVVRAIDAEMRPLPHDLEVHRRVEQARFGQVPPQELEGYKVKDAGWLFASLDPDDTPTGIHMRIRVPAGTRGVVVDEERGLLALDRELELAIVGVEPNGRGGWNMDMVVLHRAKRGEGGDNSDQDQTDADGAGSAGNTDDGGPDAPGDGQDAQPELPLEPAAPTRERQDAEPAPTQTQQPTPAPAAEPVMPRPQTADEQRRFVDEPELAAFRQPLQPGDTREYRMPGDSWVRIRRGDGDDFEVSERGVWGEAYPDSVARFGSEDDARREVAWRMAESFGDEPPQGERPRPLPDEPSEPTADERIAEMRDLDPEMLPGYVQALKGARLTAVARSLGVNRGRVAEKRAAIVDAVRDDRSEGAPSADVDQPAPAAVDGPELAAPPETQDSVDSNAWWDDDDEIAVSAGDGVPSAAPVPDSPPMDIAQTLESGITGRRQLTGGQMADAVELLEFGDGSQLVRKRIADVPDGEWGSTGYLEAAEQADAEELASMVASAFGVRAPAVYRSADDEIFMDYMPGEPAAAALTEDAIERGAAGLTDGQLRELEQLGLFDVVVGNEDRNLGNWLIADDGTISAIDHSLAWRLEGDVPDRDVLSVFSAQFVAEDGSWSNDVFSPKAMAEFRTRLEELRPEFVRRDREGWLDSSLTRLDALSGVASGDRDAPERRATTSVAGGAPASTGGTQDPDAPQRNDADDAPTVLPSWLDDEDDDEDEDGPSGDTAAAGVPAAVERVRAAYKAELATRQDQADGQWVSLTKLRAHMTGMGTSRAEQDEAIMQAAREQGVSVVPENNQKALTAADRAAAVHFGGQDKHLIAFDATFGDRPGRQRPIESDDEAPADEPEPSPPLVSDTPARGQAALDAAPAVLTPGPESHFGNYDGERLDGPPGMGSVRALSEYVGVEYERTNDILRGLFNPPPPGSPDYDGWLERERRVRARIAEIDKTMAASQLTQPVEVRRVIRHGSRVFGRDVWYGGIVDWHNFDTGTDRWEAGERPDLTGVRWHEDAYVSTTVDDDIARKFGRRWVGPGGANRSLDGEPVIMRITAPPGVGAVQMSGLDREGELLFERGVDMEITADHGVGDDGFRHVDVRLIPAAEVVPDGQQRTGDGTDGEGVASAGVDVGRAGPSGVGPDDDGLFGDGGQGTGQSDAATGVGETGAGAGALPPIATGDADVDAVALRQASRLPQIVQQALDRDQAVRIEELAGDHAGDVAIYHRNQLVLNSRALTPEAEALFEQRRADGHLGDTNGAPMLDHVIGHEFGHGVAYQMTPTELGDLFDMIADRSNVDRPGRRDDGAAFLAAWIEYARKAGAEAQLRRVGGDYGLNDWAEWIAEAWSGWVNGSTNPLTQAVGRWIEALLNRPGRTVQPWPET